MTVGANETERGNLGIDVSHHQGAIDWPAVQKDGVDFVYLKATEGDAYVDPTFHENSSQLELLSIHTGAYHYFHADKDPLAQARHFIDVVKESPEFILPPAVDIEELDSITGEDAQERLLTWLKEVEAAFGVKPLIYTVTGFVQNVISDNNLHDYGLWFAKYDTDELELPEELKNFTWTIWQYGQGKIAGISSNVDQNYFNCDVKRAPFCSQK